MLGASPCPDISPQLHLDNAVHHACYWSSKSRQVKKRIFRLKVGIGARVSTLWFGENVYEWQIKQKGTVHILQPTYSGL